MARKANPKLNKQEVMQVESNIPIPIIPTLPATPKKQSMTTTAQSVWGISPASAASTERYIKKMRMTHGMFANIPMICKDASCPYIDTCEIDPLDRVLGQRCPQEAAVIMTRFETYCDHFGIDLSGNSLNPSDAVDAGLVRDLVDLEVQMLRAENKAAIRGDFMGLRINTVDKRGKVHYEETITPEAEFKNTLMEKRYKILNLLNATRKDKVAMSKPNDNPSVKAVSIFKKVNEIMSKNNRMNIYDVEEAIIVEETPSIIEEGE